MAKSIEAHVKEMLTSRKKQEVEATKLFESQIEAQRLADLADDHRPECGNCGGTGGVDNSTADRLRGFPPDRECDHCDGSGRSDD